MFKPQSISRNTAFVERWCCAASARSCGRNLGASVQCSCPCEPPRMDRSTQTARKCLAVLTPSSHFTLPHTHTRSVSLRNKCLQISLVQKKKNGLNDVNGSNHRKWNTFSIKGKWSPLTRYREMREIFNFLSSDCMIIYWIYYIKSLYIEIFLINDSD